MVHILVWHIMLMHIVSVRYRVQALGAPAPMRISSYFWYKDDVKILNNSWGSNVYPFIDTEIKNAKVSGS